MNHRDRIVALGTWALLLLGAWAATAAAADSHEALAKKLSNPVASLISVPFQLNYDHDIGPDDDGERYTLNLQPVIPIDLDHDWNVISRSIVPVIYQDDVAPGRASKFGTGDIVQSFFLSPKDPTASGWIWGAGPVLLLPAGSDEMTADKWGIGPTGVALKQEGPWTYGALANHIWSFAGEDDAGDVSSTFVQPFLSYTTSDAVSFVVNSESSYDWKAEEWSVPINVLVTRIVPFGSQLTSIGVGVRYWADSPPGGPEGFGLRLQLVLLFPR